MIEYILPPGICWPSQPLSFWNAMGRSGKSYGIIDAELLLIPCLSLIATEAFPDTIPRSCFTWRVAEKASRIGFEDTDGRDSRKFKSKKYKSYFSLMVRIDWPHRMKFNLMESSPRPIYPCNFDFHAISIASRIPFLLNMSRFPWIIRWDEGRGALIMQQNMIRCYIPPLKRGRHGGR